MATTRFVIVLKYGYKSGVLQVKHRIIGFGLVPIPLLRKSCYNFVKDCYSSSICTLVLPMQLQTYVDPQVVIFMNALE